MNCCLEHFQVIAMVSAIILGLVIASFSASGRSEEQEHEGLYQTTPQGF